MIKNNESKVEITTRNIKYYRDRNYKCNVGEIISIDVSMMPKMSHNKVITICEVCFSENELSFSKYNKNKDRHGFYSCKKCSSKKRKITNLERYGVAFIPQLDRVKEENRIRMSSDSFKEKSKESIIKKYGVDSFSKTEEFKLSNSIFHKNRISNLKQEGVYFTSLSLPDNQMKKEKGMFDKYGASYSFNVTKIKSKIQNINLEKYGCITPFGNKDIQNKSKKIILEKYGVENVFQSEEVKNKIKKTNLKRYDKEYYSQSIDFKNKSKETSMRKYGVSYPMQNIDIFNLQKKSAFKTRHHNDLKYQGTYELDFLKFCDENKIEVIDGIMINYEHNGKNRKYYSDFYLPKYRLICEIKSTYIFELEKDKNLLKREFSISSGYNFLFIMDKNYDELINYLLKIEK